MQARKPERRTNKRFAARRSRQYLAYLSSKRRQDRQGGEEVILAQPTNLTVEEV